MKKKFDLAIKITATFVLCFCLNLPIKAQFHFTHKKEDKELLMNLLDKVYNFDFQEAKALLPEVYKRFPNHPVGDFFDAMILYWQITPMSKENPQFKSYVYHIERVLALSEPLLKKPEQREEAYYFLLAAHSSLTLANVKQKNYMAAIAEAKSSYEYMRKGFDLTKKNPEFHFSTGLYHFYAEQYPNTHPFMRPFMYFFAKGDIKYGLEELEKGSKEGMFTETESAYFYAHVHLKYLAKPTPAYPYLKKLHEKYPNNNWYLSRYIECLIELKHYKEAEALNSILEKATQENYQFNSLLFKGLLAYHYHNDLAAAKIELLKAKKITETSKKHVSDYLSFVYLYLGFIYEREHAYKTAAYYIDKAEEDSEYESIRAQIKAFRIRNKR